MRILGWYQDPSLLIQYIAHTTNHRYLPTVLFYSIFLPETCISPTCRVFGEQELYLIQLFFFFTKSPPPQSPPPPPPPPLLLLAKKTADLVRPSLRIYQSGPAFTYHRRRHHPKQDQFFEATSSNHQINASTPPRAFWCSRRTVGVEW